MRDRVVLIGAVAGLVVLAGAGVGVAAVAGAFSSSSPSAATTTTALGLGEGQGGGAYGSGGGSGGGGRHFGRGGGGGIFRSFGAAGTYLGVSTQQLFTDLQDGKTLAQLAKAQGKPVSGLVAAMVAAEKQSLERAVAAGYMTQSQEQQIASSLQAQMTRIVNGSFGGGGGGGTPPNSPPTAGFA